MDRGAWQAVVYGVAKSQTQLSDFTSLHFTWTFANGDHAGPQTEVPRINMDEGAYFHKSFFEV